MVKDKGLKKTFRMYNKLGFSKFMKRWGAGIEGITPLQSVKVSMWSLILVLVGILWGVIITIFYTKSYWLGLILVASLPLTFMQFVANYQKYKKLKEVEEILKGLDKPVQEEELKQ